MYLCFLAIPLRLHSKSLNATIDFSGVLYIIYGMSELLERWILYFAIYSLGGYLVEVVKCSLKRKQFTNRGFLFGPVLPIYGFGAVLFALAIDYIEPLRGNLILTFLAAVAICTVLEYITSFLMEKLFKIRWWDYRGVHRFQLNGRICLQNSLLFGLGGIVMAFIQPRVAGFISWLDPTFRTVLAWVAVILFTVDTIASTYAALRARGMVTKGVVDFEQMVGDQTNEVKKLCREAIKQLFSRGGSLELRARRLMQEGTRAKVQGLKNRVETGSQKRKKKA